KGPARAQVSDEGRTIALPAILRRYETREANVRLYTVMTAHEAGHLEFGTYRLSLDRLADMIQAVRTRYGRTQDPATLAEVFALYPQPGLIRDLWTLLEDARVEYLLQLEYPGLKSDLAALAREAVTTRSLLHGMTAREMAVDALLLLSTQEPDAFRIPEAMAEVVEQAWSLCRAVLNPSATAEDAVRLADRVYVVLDDLLAAKRPMGEGGAAEPNADLGAGPKASEETAGEYRPVANWAYRGEMNPELVTDRGAGGEEQAEHPQGLTFASAEAFGRSGSAGRGSQGQQQRELPSEDVVRGQDPGSVVDEFLAVEESGARAQPDEPAQANAFLYDEWDGIIQDYRQGWCRVVERTAPDGATDCAAATLAEHGAAVRLLRRYFEALRPPGLRRVSGQTDGEELDLDAVVRRRAELAAGADSSDRLYVRREKCERDVAAAFLVDLSGSTSRQIESSGGQTRRVIDIEKEGLLLLGEALEAIGDRYAVYGYSGRGRRQVDFVTLKAFDEPAGMRMASRLGAVEPLQQNRDGAAIRHATRKLLAQPAKVRLLVLLSDGKPLDEGYADEYSLEDTKAALREARAKGLHPFCITVDRGADDYLKRMYGEVRYLVIDHAGALPEQLPRTYRRLTA
ncbi:MAG: nitric oxide reductase activation protein NorD, partial [Nitrospiraceae bacterium]